MKFHGRPARTPTTRAASEPGARRGPVHHRLYPRCRCRRDAPVGAVYNVGGMMTAGNVVNAIPPEVTFTVDSGTVDAKMLQEPTRRSSPSARPRPRRSTSASRVSGFRSRKTGGRPESSRIGGHTPSYSLHRRAALSWCRAAPRPRGACHGSTDAMWASFRTDPPLPSDARAAAISHPAGVSDIERRRSGPNRSSSSLRPSLSFPT